MQCTEQKTIHASQIIINLVDPNCIAVKASVGQTAKDDFHMMTSHNFDVRIKARMG